MDELRRRWRRASSDNRYGRLEFGCAPLAVRGHLSYVSHDHLIESGRVESIIGGFYAVYNYYGYGLPESAYAGALEHELRDRGFAVDRELAVRIGYKGRHVCWVRLDFVVDQRIVVEVKAAEKTPPYAERQLFNYLRATTLQVGLLLHFGPRPTFRKLVETSNPRSVGAAVISAGSGTPPPVPTRDETA